LVVGGHGYQAQTETHAVLDSFVLTAVLITIADELFVFLRERIRVHQAVGVVGTRTGVRRRVFAGGVEVRVQDLLGLRFVAHVDHAQRCCGAEPVPVGSTACPLQIVPQECIIGSIGIHNTILPDSC